MTKSNRNDVRAAISDNGWIIVWGDLINEFDLITFIVSVPTATVGLWVSQQVEAQIQKFGQSMADVSDDVLEQATKYLENLLKRRKTGERDFDGLGVKGGIATYKRWEPLPLHNKLPLPNNHQPYIGIRVMKPLPPKGVPASASGEVLDTPESMLPPSSGGHGGPSWREREESRLEESQPDRLN